MCMVLGYQHLKKKYDVDDKFKYDGDNTVFQITEINYGHGYLVAKSVYTLEVKETAIPLEDFDYALKEGHITLLTVRPELKCECGAEKTGDISHSHWCPKYGDPV